MFGIWLARLLGGAILVAFLVIPSGEVRKVRPAAVAGSFYPSDPAELRTLADRMLNAASIPTLDGHVWAILSPHAGYPYSGPIAAHAYAALRGRQYRRVVVIAPSHFEGFDFSSIYNGDAYETPLGTIPVDKEFAARLAKLGDSSLRLSDRGHVKRGEQGEHSLEVQLPFLQRTLGEFRLVPVIMGDQSYQASRALGVALSKIVQSRDTLIAASSDLSHYHPYGEAVQLDRKPLQALQDCDYFNMSRNFATRSWEACGGGPIVAAMIAAERLGATQAVLLKYANSGDITGDKNRVVGYGAAALVQAKVPPRTALPESALTAADREELLALARRSVETAVRSAKLYEAPAPRSEALLQDHGAFVTLKRHGELRGCIGYTSAVKSLHLTVRDVAAFAALRDPRFPPVTPGELENLEYEVSVLSPFRRVKDVNDVQVGRHGLMAKKGEFEGVLLPQVPVEQRWDRKTFLEQVCRKAGLPPTCWNDPDTDLFLFSAQVFGEEKTVKGGRQAPSAWMPEPAALVAHSAWR